jgi:hypothetical protein
VAHVREGSKSYTAEVAVEGGKKKKLAIADPDAFAFNLEAAIEQHGGMFDGDKVNVE